MITLLAVLALLAVACGQSTTSDTSTAELPEALASTEQAASEVEEAEPEERLDRVLVAARDTVAASPLWIADAEGFFEANGLEVEFIPVTDASELTANLIRFEAQVVVESVATAVARADVSRADISLISYLDATVATTGERGAIVLVAPADVSWSGCDLIGRRVGVSSLTSLETIALREMVENSPCAGGVTVENADGTDADNPVDTAANEVEDSAADAEEASVPESVPGVEIVVLDASTQKLQLANGEIDAGVFTDPNTTRLLRENEDADVPVRIVANLDLELCRSQRCPISAAVAANSWLENSPDVSRRFTESINETIDWIRENDFEYRAALVDCCALTAQDASDIPAPNFVGREGDLNEELGLVVDILIDQGRIEDPNIADRITQAAG